MLTLSLRDLVNTTILVVPGSSTSSYMYAGPGTKCFDPISFYYGCILNSEQAALDAAEACTFAVTGTANNNGAKKNVGPVQFVFPTPVSFCCRCSDGASSLLFADGHL